MPDIAEARASRQRDWIGQEKTIPDALSPARIRELIQSSFPLTPVPGVPEIRLHKAGPGSGLWRFADADKDFDAPYWAYHWGGGLALARHVLDHPQTVAGCNVLDLGSGSGIVAIAAAKAGAAHVTAADIDRYAIEAIGLNAAANDVGVTPLLGDLTGGPAPDADIILVGDLFYDVDLAQRVTAFLDRCMAANIKVLVGDPWRATLPLSRLTLLAEYEGGDFGAGAQDALRNNGVFAFKPA